MENYKQSNNILVSVSIVSHGQSNIVKNLLEDLKKLCDSHYEIIITLNIEEKISFDIDSFPFFVHIIRNLRPRGFSENHNSAFAVSAGKYFCVLNPDIRLDNNPFTELLSAFGNKNIGMVAPKVISPEGSLEDSIRPFPNPITIFAKLLNLEYMSNDIAKILARPHWVAGMFILFDRTVFEMLNGFDERYFLYYEDVDICARLQFSGYRIAYCSKVAVIHEAQRTSHGNIKYLRWHLSSMSRFFTSKVFFRTLFSD